MLKVLAGLFRVQGVPLELKTDNGCTFLAEATQPCLSLHAVEALYSPPYTPRYNGAVEAGIGSLASRTEQAAAWRGYPGSWNYDDAVVARREANAAARPRGQNGPSPDELWHARTPITLAERQAFGYTLTALRRQMETAAENCQPTTEMRPLADASHSEKM